MKFIDFNQDAINCLSIDDFRILAERDVMIAEFNKSEIEPEKKELYVICLSYDKGVRRQRVSDAPHMAGISREVVDEELINCHYATIKFERAIAKSPAYWELDLALKTEYVEKKLTRRRNHRFPCHWVEFETLEDAIKAANLCKNATTVCEAVEIISANFPQFTPRLIRYLEVRKVRVDDFAKEDSFATGMVKEVEDCKKKLKSSLIEDADENNL